MGWRAVANPAGSARDLTNAGPASTGTGDGDSVCVLRSRTGEPNKRLLAKSRELAGCRWDAIVADGSALRCCASRRKDHAGRRGNSIGAWLAWVLGRRRCAVPLILGHSPVTTAAVAVDPRGDGSER